MTQSRDTIIAVIPSRAGSERILEKNLQKVGGYTLIEWACNHIPDYVTHTIVTTDCLTSARIAKEYGYEVVKRPKALSTELISGIASWQHALSVADGVRNMEFDCTILLQPTTPTRKPHDISRCVDMVIREGWDSACTVSPVPDQWAPYKQVEVHAGKLQLVERRRTARYSRNGACFAANVVGLMGDFYSNCCAVMSQQQQVNIDEPFDLEIARLLLR